MNTCSGRNSVAVVVGCSVIDEMLLAALPFSISGPSPCQRNRNVSEVESREEGERFTCTRPGSESFHT